MYRTEPPQRNGAIRSARKAPGGSSLSLPHRIDPFTMCKYTFTLLLALIGLLAGFVQAANYTVLYKWTSDDCSGPFYQISIRANTSQFPCETFASCSPYGTHSIKYFCQEYPASFPAGMITDSFWEEGCSDFDTTNFYPNGICGNGIYNTTAIYDCQDSFCNVTFVSGLETMCRSC